MSQVDVGPFASEEEMNAWFQDNLSPKPSIWHSRYYSLGHMVMCLTVFLVIFFIQNAIIHNLKIERDVFKEDALKTAGTPEWLADASRKCFDLEQVPGHFNKACLLYEIEANLK